MEMLGYTHREGANMFPIGEGTHIYVHIHLCPCIVVWVMEASLPSQSGDRLGEREPMILPPARSLTGPRLTVERRSTTHTPYRTTRQ